MKPESGFAVILGAGASKGALVGTPSPPLDADFFDVVHKRFSRGGRRKGADQHAQTAWNDLIASAEKAGLDRNRLLDERLEVTSTYLEARANLNGLQAYQGHPKNFAQALSDLKRLICYGLAATNGTKACPLHHALFDLIGPPAVVTFNYDLIADTTLAEMGKLAWKRAEYSGPGGGEMGFPVVLRRVGQSDQVIRIERRKQKSRIPLLKLHGSIHWDTMPGKKYRLSLASQPADRARLDYSLAPRNPLIVPPVAAKIDIQKRLKHIWIQARGLLEKAPGWIIWGYSFPATDTVSMVLFRTALEGVRKKRIVVVNPDSKVAEAVERGLKKVSVTHYPSMEKFLLERGVTLRAPIPAPPGDR